MESTSSKRPKGDPLISAVLLAAGEPREGERMGPRTIFLRGKLLQQAVNNLLDSNVDEIVAVLGYEAEKMRRDLEGLDEKLRVVINPEYHLGLSTSIKTGLQSISQESDAVLVALGDRPLIEGDLIDRLIEGYLKGKAKIVAPVYRGLRGHPTLFDIQYKSELMRLTGDVGAREIIKYHEKDLLEVEVDSPSILIHVNERGDYLLQLRRFFLLDMSRS